MRGGGGLGESDEPPRCPRRSAFLAVSISRNGTDKCDNGTINLILEYKFNTEWIHIE